MLDALIRGFVQTLNLIKFATTGAKTARNVVMISKWHSDGSTYDEHTDASWNGYIMHNEATNSLWDINTIRVIDIIGSGAEFTLAYMLGRPLPVYKTAVTIAANFAGYLYEQSNFYEIDQAFATLNGTCGSLSEEQRDIAENMAQNGKYELHKWIAAENFIKPATDLVSVIYQMRQEPSKAIEKFSSFFTTAAPSLWKSILMYEMVGPKVIKGYEEKALKLLSTCSEAAQEAQVIGDNAANNDGLKEEL